MKILKMLSMVLLIMLTTGCSKEPRVEVRYVDRVTEKLVRVPCEVPEISCKIDKSLTYTEKITAIGRCMDDLVSLQEMMRGYK